MKSDPDSSQAYVFHQARRPEQRYADASSLDAYGERRFGADRVPVGVPAPRLKPP